MDKVKEMITFMTASDEFGVVSKYGAVICAASRGYSAFIPASGSVVIFFGK